MITQQVFSLEHVIFLTTFRTVEITRLTDSNLKNESISYKITQIRIIVYVG